MSSFNNVADVSGGGLGYGIGGGGCGVWIFLLLLFAIFMGGGRLFGGRDGHEHGGGGCGCNRPHYPDESNWEEELHLKEKMCADTDKILAGQVKLQEKADDRYIQSLRDENTKKDIIIADKNAEIRESRLIAYIDSKFCGIPKARPEYACTTAACAVNIPNCGERRCSDDWE